MTTRSPGRPRSEAARRAVLAAAAELLARAGYGTLTIEGIARRAGVSKQTIYRWWPSKAAIILDALNDAARSLAPAPNSGSLESDLRHLIHSTVAATDATAPLLAALMAEAQLDEDFAKAFRDGFLAARRAVLREVLLRARSRGQVNGSVDVELVIDIVFGTLWYRILARHNTLDRTFADQLADTAITLATHPGSSPKDEHGVPRR